MEINEFQLVTHLLFLQYLVIGLDDLACQSILLVFVLLEQRPLLSLLLLKELLDSLGLYLSSSTILSPQQNLPLEIVCVFPDLCDRHISLFQDGLHTHLFTLRVSRIASDFTLPFSMFSFRASASY